MTDLKTKSGKPITIGTGSGTKWKQYKRDNPHEFANGELSTDLISSIVLAIQNGYNHVDTAQAYDTHREVGEAVRQSGVAREDLWITDKYSSFQPGPGPYETIKSSLKELDLEYIDAYLLHSPSISVEANGFSLGDAWLQLEKAHSEGLVRYIGVSNFAVDDLKTIAEAGTITPVFNQIEYHPYLQDQTPGVVEYSKKHGIVVEAYGPLTPIFRTPDRGTLVDVLPQLADKYHRTQAQILLRWALQQGTLPITTSSKVERIKESLEIYNFELSSEDQELISVEGQKFRFRFAQFKSFEKYDVDFGN